MSWTLALKDFVVLLPELITAHPGLPFFLFYQDLRDIFTGQFYCFSSFFIFFYFLSFNVSLRILI